MKKSIVFNNVFDYVLLILLVFLSLSKGGFYKSDIIVFSLGISVIAFVYMSINIYLSIIKNKYKFDIIQILLFLLSLSYILPILFNNYADLNDSIFEAIRYFNLYCIYSILKNSSNKELYIHSIIIITIIQCILSVDAVGNRYLNEVLSSVGSGFLDIDLNRMSGTLQYANVLAILCLISFVFVFEFLLKEKKVLKKIIYYVLIFILSTTIILTGSRTVIILSLITFMILFFNNKEFMIKNTFIYLPMAVLTGIYTSLIYTQIGSINVYYTFAIFLVLSIGVAFFIYKLYKMYENKININKKNIYVVLALFVFLVLYFVISLSITKPLHISQNSNKNSNVIILNNIKNETNKISFKVDINDADSRYEINLNSIDKNNVENNIKVFNYTENSSGLFDFKFDLTDDIKYLKFYVECQKGSITIDKLYLNDNKEKLDYVFISRNLIYRFKDLIYGSTSTSDRVIYYNDAIKIIFKSASNFVIGTGGEGFKNVYEQIKTKEYYSTEVHNSFLQIFVETGIVGGLIISIILIYSLFKSKNDYIKFAYLLLIIHSFIDLNFSYMFMIAVFGILLSFLNYDKKIELSNKVLNIIFYIITLVCILFSFIILTKTALAIYMSIPNYYEKHIDLEKQIEIVKLNEKRVMLDPYEYIYRKELDKQYNIYLEFLYDSLKKQNNIDTIDLFNAEITNVVNSIFVNANIIFDNNKYNKNQILYACGAYFRNIENLSKNYYNKNNYIELSKYMNVINEKLNYLEKIYIKNSEIIDEINNIKSEYNKK